MSPKQFTHFFDVFVAGRPRASGLALSRTPPRVREDAAYVRTGQEVEHYPRMDLEDINVDEMEEGEITEDEFLEPREAEEEPMGGQEDLENEDEVGGDREFLEAGEAEGEPMGDQEEVQQQPRRFGRRWGNFVRSLLDDAREWRFFTKENTKEGPWNS